MLEQAVATVLEEFTPDRCRNCNIAPRPIRRISIVEGVLN